MRTPSKNAIYSCINFFLFFTALTSNITQAPGTHLACVQWPSMVDYASLTLLDKDYGPNIVNQLYFCCCYYWFNHVLNHSYPSLQKCGVTEGINPTLQHAIWNMKDFIKVCPCLVRLLEINQQPCCIREKAEKSLVDFLSQPSFEASYLFPLSLSFLM